MSRMILSFFVVACSSSPPPSTATPDAAASEAEAADASSEAAPPPPPMFRIARPADGSAVLGSTDALVEASGHALTRVEFLVDADTKSTCSDDQEQYRCLLDFSKEQTGAMKKITAVGYEGNQEVARASVTVKKVSPLADICKDSMGNDAAVKPCLDALVKDGKAAGNTGDYYDNLDGDHTTINAANHPGITYLHTAYGTQSIGAPAEHKDQTTALIGNASLCSHIGNECFGQARAIIYMGRAQNMNNQYRWNKFWWFPEHTDHDAIDVSRYMVPFMNNSQGSSGSEMDEVAKWLHSLAALKPAVKAALIQQKALMPALQMIFRRTRVASDSEYLSGLAHQNAFDDAPNLHAMLRWANALESAPPVVELSVVSETWSANEKHFTTNASIARIWNTNDFSQPKKITVSAKKSADPNGKPISYHWFVLRAPEGKVRVRPRAPDDSEVEIEFDHHEEQTLQLGKEMLKTRLAVVGAFVHNGEHFSAPAFVTSYAP